MYRESFGQSITSTPTVPLDQDTVYSVAITAGGICGNTTCSANCSTASIDGKNACSIWLLVCCYATHYRGGFRDGWGGGGVILA